MWPAFLNPFLLGFMALGSVPIIIHLLNKRRFRPMQWAAMEFLLQALQRNSRRLQIRDLILMLIRALAVVCLALALSRPTLAGNVSMLGAYTSNGAIILLDNSYSMGFHNGRETRFEAAKRLTTRILSQLDKDTWCGVYTFNDSFKENQRDISQNFTFLEKELDKSIFLSDGATDVELALQFARKQFKDNPKLSEARKELYIITDLQAQAWKGKGALSDLLGELSSLASIYLVDVSDASGENCALLDLAPEDTLVAPGQPVSFVAKIKNHGQSPVNDLVVDFFVDPGTKDERQIEHAVVDVDAGQITTAKAQAVFQSGGDHRIEARLGDDRLAADNRRFCTVEVVEATAVLLVDGKERKDDSLYSGETGFLVPALSPLDPEEPDTRPLVSTETIPSYRLADKNLTNYQALFLCNVPQLNANQWSIIQQQVQTGMGLFIFLGDQTDPAYYNQALGPDGADLLPAEVLEAWGRVPELEDKELPVSRHFARDEDKLAHPVTAFFKREDAKDLLGDEKVWRAFGLKPRDVEGVSVIAWFDDGKPAAIERSVGAGQVVLFPFPPTTKWSNLPTQPFFPITMQRLAQRMALGHHPDRNLSVNDGIRGFVSLADIRTMLKISAPPVIGTREIQPGEASENRAIFEFNDTDAAGFYEVALDRADARPMVYSLNPKSELESDLTRVSPERLRMDFPGFDFVHVAKSEDLTNKLASEKHGTEIWPWFMFLVFALLLAESILAHLWAPKD